MSDFEVAWHDEGEDVDIEVAASRATAVFDAETGSRRRASGAVWLGALVAPSVLRANETSDDKQLAAWNLALSSSAMPSTCAV